MAGLAGGHNKIFLRGDTCTISVLAFPAIYVWFQAVMCHRGIKTGSTFTFSAQCIFFKCDLD